MAKPVKRETKKPYPLPASQEKQMPRDERCSRGAKSLPGLPRALQIRVDPVSPALAVRAGQTITLAGRGGLRTNSP